MRICLGLGFFCLRFVLATVFFPNGFWSCVRGDIPSLSVSLPLRGVTHLFFPKPHRRSFFLSRVSMFFATMVISSFLIPCVLASLWLMALTVLIIAARVSWVIYKVRRL